MNIKPGIMKQKNFALTCFVEKLIKAFRAVAVSPSKIRSISPFIFCERFMTNVQEQCDAVIPFITSTKTQAEVTTFSTQQCL